MSTSFIETGRPVATDTAATPSAVVDANPTTRWQFWALVVGSAIAALGSGIVPAWGDGDVWSYQTLADDRGRVVLGALLASPAMLVLVAGLPLLRRYAPSRGRAAVTAGLGMFAAGTALFALGIASLLPLAIAARGELDPAAGAAFIDLAQEGGTWETAPFFVGGLLLSAIGWVVFTIGARRARTIATLPMIVLLVVGLAFVFAPPGWALGVTGAAMTVALAWLGWRVVDEPARPRVTASA